MFLITLFYYKCGMINVLVQHHALRRHPLYDINQETHHHENGDDELLPPRPPFHDGVHPALAQFMVDTTRHFAEAVARIPQRNKQAEHIGCSIHDFSSHQFRLFEGIEGPNLAEVWLTDIEVLFTTLGCTDEQKVHYIRLKLTEEAGRWWTSKKVLLSELVNKIEITWEFFKME
jgi:hypothetical protein